MKQKQNSSQESRPWASCGAKTPTCCRLQFMKSSSTPIKDPLPSLCSGVSLSWILQWNISQKTLKQPGWPPPDPLTRGSTVNIWHLSILHPCPISVNTSSWSSSINTFMIRLSHRNGSAGQCWWLRLAWATQADGAAGIHIWSRELHYASQSSLTDGGFPMCYTSFWTSGRNLADAGRSLLF